MMAMVMMMTMTITSPGAPEPPLWVLRRPGEEKWSLKLWEKGLEVGEPSCKYVPCAGASPGFPYLQKYYQKYP